MFTVRIYMQRSTGNWGLWVVWDDCNRLWWFGDCSGTSLFCGSFVSSLSQRAKVAAAESALDHGFAALYPICCWAGCG